MLFSPRCESFKSLSCSWKIQSETFTHLTDRKLMGSFALLRTLQLAKSDVEQSFSFIISLNCSSHHPWSLLMAQWGMADGWSQDVHLLADGLFILFVYCRNQLYCVNLVRWSSYPLPCSFSWSVWVGDMAGVEEEVAGYWYRFRGRNLRTTTLYLVTVLASSPQMQNFGPLNRTWV
jgi:hypothetical protein